MNGILPIATEHTYAQVFTHNNHACLTGPGTEMEVCLLSRKKVVLYEHDREENLKETRIESSPWSSVGIFVIATLKIFKGKLS